MTGKLNLISQIAIRLGSSILSIYFFATVSIILTTSEAQKIFFLMFFLGFLVSFLRMFCTFDADLLGGKSKRIKLFQIKRTTKKYSLSSPFIISLLVILLNNHIENIWTCIFLSFLVVLSGYDSDLLRSSAKKESNYSAVVLLGIVTGAATLSVSVFHTFHGILLAVILMWIPVAMNGLFSICRTFQVQTFPNELTTQTNPYKSMRSVLIAIFDGLVLNFPFFLGVGSIIDAKQSYDFSLAIRIFSSSQSLFGLVSHWANSGGTWRYAKKLHMSESVIYGSMIFISGFATSVVFVLLFYLFSKQSVLFDQYSMFLVIFCTYCFYYVKIRFFAMQISGKYFYATYGFGLGLIILLALVCKFLSLGAIFLCASQGLILFLTGWLICKSRRMSTRLG